MFSQSFFFPVSVYWNSLPEKDGENAYICIYFGRMPRHLDGRVFYTVSEVAEMAGVHRLTLLRWIREGKLADVGRDRNGWRLFSEEIAHEVTEFAKGINTRTSPSQGLLFPRKIPSGANTFQKSVASANE